MSTGPLSKIPLQFAERAASALQTGLKIEEGCMQQLQIEGDISPGQHQIAMINYSCAIESAAKCIVVKDCPPAIFTLKGKRQLDRDALRDLWNPNLSEVDLMRLLLNHYVLSFEETLLVASEVQPLLDYPVDQKILSAARNQAIHSLVLDEGRQVDLLAIAAIYMLDFILSQELVKLNYELSEEEKDRLQKFQNERRPAAERAHNALQKIRSSRLLCEEPFKYDQDRDTEDYVHVSCPMCKARARIVIDRSSSWLEPGSIVVVKPGSDRLKFFYPKHFSCPGCTLDLHDRAISESGLIFAAMPLPSSMAAWQTDATPLDDRELADFYEAEKMQQEGF